MERNRAIEKLRSLVGKDLVPLAKEHNVTIWKSPGKKNKGWAGHVVERYLGLPPNTGQEPNFGSWELKVVPLKLVGNRLVVKETMAITMINEHDVLECPFEHSHLLSKLRRMVIVARIFLGQTETASPVHTVGFFDLSDHVLYQAVCKDYELVQNSIKELGFVSLSGHMGKYIQPRTKGPGHGSTSRAFYARTGFVAQMLRLSPF